VLPRRIGSPQVMADQCAHLDGLAESQGSQAARGSGRRERTSGGFFATLRYLAKIPGGSVS
jgi:hypothetical protein